MNITIYSWSITLRVMRIRTADGKPRGKLRRRLVLGVLVVLVILVAYVGVAFWLGNKPAPPPVPGSGRASTADAPWVVVIADPGEQPDVASHKTCVGTLVAPRAVVTAAHCVARPDPSALRVTAGRDDLRSTAGRTVRVADTWTDPEFSKGLAEESYLGGIFGQAHLASGDIGLIVLADPLPGPVLPMAEAGSTPPGGASARRYGWRLSPRDKPVLWQSPTEVVGDSECRRWADESVWLLPPRWHGITYDSGSYLCAGAGDMAAPMRASDSGSPIVVNGKLAGVAAFSVSTEPTAPYFFTKVASHRDQLDHEIERLH